MKFFRDLFQVFNTTDWRCFFAIHRRGPLLYSRTNNYHYQDCERCGGRFITTPAELWAGSR